MFLERNDRVPQPLQPVTPLRHGRLAAHSVTSGKWSAGFLLFFEDQGRPTREDALVAASAVVDVIAPEGVDAVVGNVEGDPRLRLGGVSRPELRSAVDALLPERAVLVQARIRRECTWRLTVERLPIRGNGVWTIRLEGLLESTAQVEKAVGLCRVAAEVAAEDLEILSGGVDADRWFDPHGVLCGPKPRTEWGRTEYAEFACGYYWTTILGQRLWDRLPEMSRRALENHAANIDIRGGTRYILASRAQPHQSDVVASAVHRIRRDLDPIINWWMILGGTSFAPVRLFEGPALSAAVAGAFRAYETYVPGSQPDAQAALERLRADWATDEVSGSAPKATRWTLTIGGDAHARAIVGSDVGRLLGSWAYLIREGRCLPVEATKVSIHGYEQRKDEITWRLEAPDNPSRVHESLFFLLASYKHLTTQILDADPHISDPVTALHIQTDQ